MEGFLSSLTSLAAQHATNAVSKFISDRASQVRQTLSQPAAQAKLQQALNQPQVQEKIQDRVQEKLQIENFDPEQLKELLAQTLKENPEAVQQLLKQWDSGQVAELISRFNQTTSKGAPEEQISELTYTILGGRRTAKGDGCNVWIWILVIIIVALLLWWLLTKKN